MKTLLFIVLFSIGHSGMNDTNSPHINQSSQYIQHVIFIGEDSNSRIIDTVVCWRTEKRINKVMSLYVSYIRNNNTDYIVEDEIRVTGKELNGRMDGLYCFYYSRSHVLIAKALYKKGKLCGDVLIFDNGEVVAHYIYKNNRCLGICDKEGTLLKLRHHVYYYPKKKCFCGNIQH
jgi:hypothetical protein